MVRYKGPLWGSVLLHSYGLSRDIPFIIVNDRALDRITPQVTFTTLIITVNRYYLLKDLHKDTNVFTGIPVAPFAMSPFTVFVLLTAAISR